MGFPDIFCIKKSTVSSKTLGFWYSGTNCECTCIHNLPCSVKEQFSYNLSVRWANTHCGVYLYSLCTEIFSNSPKTYCGVYLYSLSTENFSNSPKKIMHLSNTTCNFSVGWFFLFLFFSKWSTTSVKCFVFFSFASKILSNKSWRISNYSKTQCLRLIYQKLPDRI